MTSATRSNRRELHGLYLITPEIPEQPRDLVTAVAAGLRGGATVVQLRDKTSSPHNRVACAIDLNDMCRHYSALFIINDDIELAAAVGADGVHLGRDDSSIDHARTRLGADAIIGASCYADLARAHTAIQRGATYVAFGRFFASTTKPSASAAPLDLITTARAQLDAPIVAIGGITPENGGALIAAGADMLAVSGALFGQLDIESTAASFAPIFL